MGPFLAIKNDELVKLLLFPFLTNEHILILINYSNLIEFDDNLILVDMYLFKHKFEIRQPIYLK